MPEEVDSRAVISGEAWKPIAPGERWKNSQTWEHGDKVFALREYGPVSGFIWGMLEWDKKAGTIRQYCRIDGNASQDGLQWAYSAAYRRAMGGRRITDVWNEPEQFPHLLGGMFFNWPAP